MLSIVVITMGLLLLYAGWRLRVPSESVGFLRTAIVPSFFVSLLIYPFSEPTARYAFLVTGVVGLIPIAQDRLLRKNPGNGPRKVVPNWRTAPLFFAILLMTWLNVRDAFGNGFQFKFLLEFLFGIAMLASFTRGMKIGEITTELLIRYAAWYMGAALILGVASPTQWLSCQGQWGKCSVVGEIYQGIFSSANEPAEFCMMALLLTCLLPKSRERLLAIIGFAAVILVTGSRTPEISLAVGVLMALISVPLMAKKRGYYRHSMFLGFMYILAVPVTGLYVVWHAKANSFSARGLVWLNIEQYITPFTGAGRGRSIYLDLLALGNFRGHYPHSEYLFLTFFGGLMAVGLYAIFALSMWRAVKATTKRLTFVRTLPLTVILIHGITEMSWNASSLDTSVWIAISLFAAISLREPAVVTLEPEPVVETVDSR